MNLKNTRGIQYEDVAQAADALLQEGSRPTIERIRLRIGRGSPNTVSPMLEQWFSQLGPRLGHANQSSSPDVLPDALQQTAMALWRAAQAAAEETAEEAWAERRTELDDEKNQLLQIRQQLQERELVLNERLYAMEAQLQNTHQQLMDSNERGLQQQKNLSQREQEITGLRTTLSEQGLAITQAQMRADTQQKQNQQERAALEERHRQTEKRWLEEIDRSRQEARKLTQQLQEAGQANQAQQQNHAAQLEEQQQRADAALGAVQASLHDALTSASGKEQQWQELLLQLQNSHAQQLAAALSTASEKTLAMPPPAAEDTLNTSSKRATRTSWMQAKKALKRHL